MHETEKRNEINKTKKLIFTKTSIFIFLEKGRERESEREREHKKPELTNVQMYHL